MFNICCSYFRTRTGFKGRSKFFDAGGKNKSHSFHDHEMFHPVLREMTLQLVMTSRICNSCQFPLVLSTLRYMLIVYSSVSCLYVTIVDVTIEIFFFSVGDAGMCNDSCLCCISLVTWHGEKEHAAQFLHQGSRSCADPVLGAVLCEGKFNVCLLEQPHLVVA